MSQTVRALVARRVAHNLEKPIFAIGDGPEGRGRIWVVAIQSKQKGKYSFGFPFREVVKYIHEAPAELGTPDYAEGRVDDHL